jgi:hypothetical protein
MDSLQILHSQCPQIFLGSGEGGMAENAPQVFEIAAPPQVVHGEAVAEVVRSELVPNLLADEVEVSLQIADGNLGTS